MPDEGTVSIVVPSQDGDEEMANELAGQAHEQNMAQLQQVGVVAQQNFVTLQKVIDYDFQEGKAMVSLTEALGAREVGARITPGGPVAASP